LQNIRADWRELVIVDLEHGRTSGIPAEFALCHDAGLVANNALEDHVTVAVVLEDDGLNFLCHETIIDNNLLGTRLALDIEVSAGIGNEFIHISLVSLCCDVLL
jgi:hypothetical protein